MFDLRKKYDTNKQEIHYEKNRKKTTHL